MSNMSTPVRMSMVFFVTLLCMVPTGLGQVAPAPQPDCFDSLTDLLPCVDYVTNASNTIPQECCTGLTTVKNNAPLCLCSFLNTNSSADLGINVTRALELPVFCKLNLNPADCAATGTPPVAPTTAPVPSTTPAPPTSTPSPSTSPAPVSSPAAAPPTIVSPSPPPVECNSKIAELAPCLSFVTGQTDPPPSTECCSRLTNVVGTAPSCLCTLLDPGAAASVPGLNSTLALELPQFCQVSFDVAVCTGGSTPTTPGAGAPIPSAGSSGLPGNYASMTVARPFLTIILLVAVTLQLLQ